jgi:hypothetical protein
MTKWITAECSGPMFWVLEDLLAFGTKRLNSLKGGVKIVYMKVEVHRSPMALKLAPVIGRMAQIPGGRAVNEPLMCAWTTTSRVTGGRAPTTSMSTRPWHCVLLACCN